MIRRITRCKIRRIRRITRCNPIRIRRIIRCKIRSLQPHSLVAPRGPADIYIYIYIYRVWLY